MRDQLLDKIEKLVKDIKNKQDELFELQEQLRAIEETKEKTHTVKSGDTLWAIAEKYYGKGQGHKFDIIVKSNDILDPDSIFPGQELKIPSE